MSKCNSTISLNTTSGLDQGYTYRRVGAFMFNPLAYEVSEKWDEAQNYTYKPSSFAISARIIGVDFDFLFSSTEKENQHISGSTTTVYL